MPIRPPSENLYKLYREKRADIEVFSVKLTDSALRALENISQKQSIPIKFSVDGSRGTLTIPTRQSSVSYDLSISPANHTSDGTVDVIKLLGSRAINLGKAVSKLTVQAKADSFSAAKMRMAEAEDQRKGYTKQNIMPNSKRPNIKEGSFNSRSVLTPPPRNSDTRISPSLVRNPSPLVNTYKSPVSANAEVASRSLRDRIIHLLAIQSYQRPELLLRLKRDGLTDEQKDKVDGILSKVGRTGRQGEFYLSPTFINLVEPNWPGYSPSERSFVASLMARLSTNSPSSRLSLEGAAAAARVTPSSRQSSPLTVVPTQSSQSSASIDDFGRKPTRASAPSAPHPLQKKIAALDLLASGLSLVDVAAHHGIPTSVLESWKNSEEILRERYSQRRGSTVPQTAAAPLSSVQDTSKAVNSSNTLISDSVSNDPINNSKGINSRGTSKPSAPKRVRLSSNESGVHSCGSGSSNSGNCLPPLQSASSSTAPPSRRSGVSAVIAPAPVVNSSFKDPSPPSTSKRSSPSSRKRSYDTVNDSVIGEEFSRRNNAPSSSRPINGAQSRRANDRGSESSFCLDSSSPAVEATSPLSQFYPRGPVIDPKMIADKGQRLDTSNEDKTSEASEDDFLYDAVTTQNAEINRQYPPITNARQAANYRQTFESLYPQYLELYEHYRVAWNKVITLKDQIMAHAGSQDSQRMTRLATELDEFLNRMRKPERRKEEVRLLVMTYKLQHLKQQLANYAAQANGSAVNNESSSRNSLRAGASD